MTPSPRLTQELRQRFGQIADFLIPSYRNFPPATAVGVHEGLLDDVLKFRPDLVEAFHRGLESIDTARLSESLNALYREDSEAFNALTLAASGGYYMAPQIRQILGYPGQESVSYDPYAVATYLTDGLLERVVRRGPIYRSTPTD